MKRTIKGIRTDMGLSAEDFALKTGVTEDVLHNYETGRTVPNIVFVNNLLELTKLKYDDIIFLPEDCNLIANGQAKQGD